MTRRHMAVHQTGADHRATPFELFFDLVNQLHQLGYEAVVTPAQ